MEETSMKKLTIAAAFAAALGAGVGLLNAQQPGFTRTVLQDQDLTAQGRHAVVARAEFVPGGQAGRHTRQAVDPLLDSAEVRSGARTLDVASGPGYAAAAAAARGARVAALDFSAAMVELARSQNPEIEFREGDAEALPFPEGSFDALARNFGMLHLAQPERAVAEALRVLRAGGRFAFTVWAKPEAAVGFGFILDAIRKHGNPDVPLPPGPPFFRFSDASEGDKILKIAGFRNVDVRKVPQVWRFSASRLLFEAFLAGSVRTQALLHGQSAPALAAIRDAVARVAGEYENHGTVEIPMPAVLAAALKP